MKYGRKSAYISKLVGLALAGLVTDSALARPLEESRSAETGRPAPISDVAYEVTFDESTAPFRQISVAMSFRAAGPETVILSLPAWTPGSYELDNYARNVLNFDARSGETVLRWDKVDWDTWRVFPAGAEHVTVTFDYRADALDTGSAWTAPDFAFFNGTNLFLYPEEQGYGFSSRVKFRTEPGWRVVTGMTPGSRAREYVAADFHELVDMPTFIGRFEVDSAEIDGVLHRLATYPAGFVTGGRREGIWAQLRGMMPPMAAVFDEMPFETYTTFMVFPEDFGGASALEHRNSHLGIYAPQLVESPVLPSVVAHEIFHAWNVKRLRPAPLVPYEYGRPQPTTLLWVSEGITSYYDDLSLVRGGVYGRDHFYRSTAGDIGTTERAGAVALEDASLTAWIGSRDGTGGIYYPKGAVAGFLLDILIRDVTNNEASLDDVMRELYWGTYKETFTGFSEAAWWATVKRIAAGVSFDDFYARYVDGREPYPWDDVLPLAGLTLHQETTVRPLVGIFPAYDSLGVRVDGLSSGGAAADGGVREGDYLLRAGPVELGEPEDFDEFRTHFSNLPEGTTYEVVVRRGAEELTLELDLRLSEDVQHTLVEDPDASPKAVRIRESILAGS
jgi:predicted metalloprotease with PDZ domain